MSMEHYYEVELKWDADRKGTLSSRELDEKIVVATPPDFPKGIPGIWSPEHLLIASVTSCFMTTFLAIAENSKLEFESLSINANGNLDKVEGKLMMHSIKLLPSLIIKNASDNERALRILEKSEAACLISNSLKTTIKLMPTVNISKNNIAAGV